MAKSNRVPASPPRHRRRRRHHSSHPSTIVFAALSSIIASASADGHPLACQPNPPDFLCPPIDYQEHLDLELSSLPGPSFVATPTARRKVGRAVPDSYTQGSDGRWRKGSEWTFYGSTMCLCDGTTATSDLLTGATALPDILDSLPTGWSLDTSPNKERTGLILSVSLVLACMITAFIVGCIFWRKQRKRRAEKDPEKKFMRKKVGEGDDIDIGTRKLKLWIRASARWKDNIKYSARRRRNVRSTPPSSSQPSVYPSRPPSPIASVRSSLPLSRPTTPAPPATVHAADPDATPSSTRPLENTPYSRPPSPPAYQGNPATLPTPLTTKASFPPELLHRPTTDEPLSLSPDDHPPTQEEEEPQYTLSHHVAHVATDDKAILQRIAATGSEPPVEGGSNSIQSSAPILYDDDHQGFSCYTETYPQDDVEPSDLFPAPPEPQPSSKGKMVALEFYDYEDLDVGPSLEPSAPPFDALDSSGPSAPPLDFETEDMVPSAPTMDGYDTLGGASAPAEGSEGSLRATTSSHDRPRSTERHESLPRYQP